MSRIRAMLIYLVLMSIIVGLIAYQIVYTSAKELPVSYSVSALLLLAFFGIVFRIGSREFSLTGCATMIQGLSIGLMICGIGIPLRHIMSNPYANAETLMMLVRPTAEALFTMATGIILAVVLNFVDEHLSPPTRLEVNIADIDFGDLEGGLSRIDEQLKQAQASVTAFSSSFDGAGEKVTQLVKPLNELKTLVDQVGGLVKQMNVFFKDARRE